MPKKVRDILFAPRTWLAIGAFCIGCSLVVRYHAEYRSAQEVLHSKVGAPEEVLIQNFAPDLHMNLVRQVRILGETDVAHSQEINLGTVDAPKWVAVVPIYPVGPEFAPLVAQMKAASQTTPRRPMPRDKSADVARVNASIGQFKNHAFAFAICEIRKGGPVEGNHVDHDMEVLANVDGREMVRISGAIVTGAEFMQNVSTAMAAVGVESTPETLIIEPTHPFVAATFPRAEALQLQSWLTALGVLSALFAMVLPVVRDATVLRRCRTQSCPEVKATHTFPAVSFFQPIATQDELLQEEAAKDAHGRVGTSGLVSGLKNAWGTIQNGVRLKSPQ